MQIEGLKEISHDATLEASKALSRLVNAPVSIESMRVEVKNRITLMIDPPPSELIYAISGEISGDSHGLAALVLSRESACGLCDLMLERPLKTTEAITQEGEDALLELGNIVVGNYLRVFARAMPGTTFVHRKARILSGDCSKMTRLLTDSLPAAKPLDSLLFEVAFNFRHAALVGCIIIAMEAGRLRTLFEMASSAKS